MTRRDSAFDALAAMDGRRRPGGAASVAALLGVALLPALVLFGLWRFADGRGGDTEPLDLTPAAGERGGREVQVLRTGLMSFRRLPAPLARDVHLGRFDAALGTFAGTIGEQSCLSVSLDGAAVHRAGAARSVIPASSLKIVVGAVALERLGGDHRFTTTLAGTAQDGVVTGDLYLIGGGDPLLTSDAYPIEADREPVFNETSLDVLAQQLVDAGITRVDGDVVGDGSRYDDELYAPDWVEADRGVEAGPVDALLVNDARVTGSVTRSEDPALGGAQELVNVLAAKGISVGGVGRPGTSPPDAPELGTVQSMPLRDVVAEMLTTSDNNTAESLLKELGVADGTPGSRRAGLEVVRQQLTEWNADLAGTNLTDASGLSATNTVTCEVLQTVLVGSGHAEDLAAGMAVAGETGTLSDVFVGSPVAGRLVAKTGTLGNAPFDANPPAAKGLVGYLPIGEREVIEFSLVLNGPTINDQAEYLPLWDAFAAVLASYPQGPTADELGPLR